MFSHANTHPVLQPRHLTPRDAALVTAQHLVLSVERLIKTRSAEDVRPQLLWCSPRLDPMWSPAAGAGTAGQR